MEDRLEKVSDPRILHLKEATFEQPMVRAAPKGRRYLGPSWPRRHSIAESESEEDVEEPEMESTELYHEPERPKCEVGRLRSGLPMTRRGVSPLLNQYEVEGEDLRLRGEPIEGRRRLIQLLGGPV